MGTRGGVSVRDTALVFAGGALGAGARQALTSLSFGGSEAATLLAINVSGSLALGLLLGHLAVAPRPGRRAHNLRLLLGTGVLGGYTSYSALALVTLGYLPGRPLLGLAYGAASVVGGLAAAALGAVFASWLTRGAGGASETGTEAAP